MMGRVTLPVLLKTMVEQAASDLHITVGVPPELRMHGKMVKVKADPLTSQETKEICYSVLTDAQKLEFERNLDVTFSFTVKDVARFRGSVFFQKGNVAGVFRRIPLAIPELESIPIPLSFKKILQKTKGLVLVAGPAGSGRSTTLAAMVDTVNRDDFGHILTIEDPIEFTHPHKNCVVNQREIGRDTRNLGNALKSVLKQDPDCILIGEIRDVETIDFALNLAESRKLVLGSLHATDVVQALGRLIHAFPPYQQPQVRQALSSSLQGILCQKLIPKSTSDGFCLAVEFLVPTDEVRNLIREDKLFQISIEMQKSQNGESMQTMNQSLVTLVRDGYLSKDRALEYSHGVEEISKLLTSVREKRP